MLYTISSEDCLIHGCDAVCSGNIVLSFLMKLPPLPLKIEIELPPECL